MVEMIRDYLLQQTVLTMATAVDNKPYCASCFYVYSESLQCLIIKSDFSSVHVQSALSNELVAGTILPDQLQLNHICGLQYTGRFIKPEDELFLKTNTLYHERYPYASDMKGDLWILELEYVKYTDSKLGFGKKLIWTKSAN